MFIFCSPLSFVRLATTNKPQPLPSHSRRPRGRNGGTGCCVESSTVHISLEGAGRVTESVLFRSAITSRVFESLVSVSCVSHLSRPLKSREFKSVDTTPDRRRICEY
eukprot:scaffold1976_cov187-Alexandrium_tamarense.AAC.8